ncbi:MAG: 30S ribosomal protein S4e [Candidatus Bathyarchaeota archaeon]|nr:30S ribosomal protein S4e [Candidatus Bathyarchaeota archaeon]
MGKNGKTARLKRKPAPKFWPIHKKEALWTIKPSSGPHSLHGCLPLALVLRDILKVAENRKEAKKAISQGKVLVDGKTRRDDEFPVGLMDVISMPDAGKYYRIMPNHKGLFLESIGKDESNFKLCRIEGKKTTPSGIQLNFHDGTNLTIKVADSKNPREDIYQTFDMLKLSVPSKEIVGCLSLKEGNSAIITGGKNIGVRGKIVEIEKAEAKKRRNALVIVEDEKGARYQTILDFVFSLEGSQPLTAPAPAPEPAQPEPEPEAAPAETAPEETAEEVAPVV